MEKARINLILFLVLQLYYSFSIPLLFLVGIRLETLDRLGRRSKCSMCQLFIFLFVLMWLLVSPSWASCKSGLCISTSICVPFGLSSLPASCKDLHIVPFSDSGVSPAWPLNTLFYLSSSRENPSIFLLKFLSLLASSF